MIGTAARITGRSRVAAGTITLLAEDIHIPPGLTDLEKFRKWARSDAFPERGRFSWIDGELRADLSMEQAYIHNLIKIKFCTALTTLVETEDLGYLFGDGMRFTYPSADLSVEPDAFFISYATMRSGRIKQLPPAKGEGVVEFEGAPDMVLEVVSPSSVRQDTEDLRELYWEAGIIEYWLVDARGEAPRFDLFRRGKKGYSATRVGAKGLRSTVFGRFFRLMRRTDSLGNPVFTLHVAK
jgi:Uma2 family endonuclease